MKIRKLNGMHDKKKKSNIRMGGCRLAPVLKTAFINVPYHILVASLALMAQSKLATSFLRRRLVWVIYLGENCI